MVIAVVVTGASAGIRMTNIVSSDCSGKFLKSSLFRSLKSSKYITTAVISIVSVIAGVLIEEILCKQ